MQTLIGCSELYRTRFAVFRIATRDRGDVFMRVSRSNYRNAERFVVEVDPRRFLAMWRSDPDDLHVDVSHGDRAHWLLDDKFAYAERGFSHGQSNPVPLANVGCHVLGRAPCVSITNGVTRTIWLLAFGAESFPVECGHESAEILQRVAGLAGGHPASVEHLVPEAQGCAGMGRGPLGVT